MKMQGKVTVERNIQLIRGKYRALISRKGRSIYGGEHETLHAARCARAKLEKEHPATIRRKPTNEERLERMRKYMRKVRKKREASGLCPQCGDEPPAKDRSTCFSCALTHQMYQTEQRRRKREEREGS